VEAIRASPVATYLHDEPALYHEGRGMQEKSDEKNMDIERSRNG
jgi:hypothetical protein